MSNCIDIENCRVAFTHQEIDIDRFDAFLKAATQEKSPVAWWFLQTCTRIVRAGKLGAVQIDFGWGRSTHTHADFRSVIEAIRPFMLRNKNHTFVIQDTDDGRRLWFRVPVEFRSGKIDGRTDADERRYWAEFSKKLDAEYAAGKIKVTVVDYTGELTGNDKVNVVKA